MPTEIAKAYVQIVPSAKGIKGKITEELGGEAEAAGKSAGSSIAGAIKTAIAAAGIGAALKSALNEGAALQQSIGGIETLFKDSAETVKAAATEAYRTAGLSANEYMETVTSFSASLLQGLGGDTAAAASIADMAITDMSDNANKMGTDMSLIQNAYMGFAKQNYTMLDNLKLGYGGTKKEMERLLKDAEKLTGIKYDISNLSDIYEAIHVIQEDLDITGTTAKEAATTFSGSLASMKAAGKNLLANLALGEDIGPSLYALQETIYTFGVNNLLPMVGDVVSNIPELIGGGLGMIIQGLNIANNNPEELVQFGIDLVTGIGDSVISALPYLAESAIMFVVALGRAIINTDWKSVGEDIVSTLDGSLDIAAMEILGTDGDLVGSVIDAIKTNLPLVVEEGWTTVKEYAAGIKAKLPQMSLSAGEVVSEFLAEIGNKAPDILQKGISMIGELVAGIIRSIPSVVSGAFEVIGNFFSAFDEYDWGKIGDGIIEGIISGLSNGIAAIIEAAKGVARAALDSAKDFLGIHSPSVVAEKEVGAMLPAGVANGVRKNTAMVTDAIKDMTKETAERMHTGLAAGAGSKGLGNAAASVAGYSQSIIINSPKTLSPYEVARQTRNATRNMVLSLQRG